MKTTRKLNLSFGCSVFAIMLSFAMLLSLLVAGDKADQLSFISAIAAFIGISVTLVVGYQIYNAVELKQKINAVEKLKIAIEQTETVKIFRNRAKRRFRDNPIQGIPECKNVY